VVHIAVAMKLLGKRNFAEAALAQGVSGLNVDRCRIGAAIPQQPGGWHHEHTQNDDGWQGGEQTTKQPPKGRFPANVVHDGQFATLFPASKSSATPRRRKLRQDKTQWRVGGDYDTHEYGDQDSASRFFKECSWFDD